MSTRLSRKPDSSLIEYARRLCSHLDMAHGTQTFALVGYSEDLEKRPLKFADPVPSSRICSACCNIPRTTYTLMCGHTFCDSCCESCSTTSQCVCPLDGDVCDRDDVVRIEYPAEQLLRRKRRRSPSTFAASAGTTSTRCPKCSDRPVLSRDVCAHLKSRCTEHVFHAAPEAPQGSDISENAQFVAFERKVEQRVGELDAKLAQLSLESVSQSEKLVEVCHNINQLKEELTDHFGAASIQSLNRLDRNEAEMKALVAHEKTIEQRVSDLDAKLAQRSLRSYSQIAKVIELCENINRLTEQFGPASDRNAAEIQSLFSEKCESLRTAVTSALESAPSDLKTHQWVLKGYAALMEEAQKNGWSLSMSDKVYLRRYLISWGIRFLKEGDNVYVALRIQLHEGREDDFLDWPFKKGLKLSIIHPDTKKERYLVVDPSTGEARKKNYCRPIGGSNNGVYFSQTKVDSSDIESDRYVKGDQLLLRVRLSMDGDVYDRDDVVRIEYPAEQLLRRKSDKLAELCHNINHVNETLKEQISPAAVQTLHRLDQNEAKIKALIANDQTIQQKVGDLDAKIAQLSLNCASMSDKLVQVCSSNIHLKEALTEQFGPALDRKAADLKALCDEKIEYLRTTFNSQLAMVRRESTTDQRVMAGYAALKEKAAKVGYSHSISHRVYLRRYLMSWGFQFEKEGEGVFIYLYIVLHEGIEDEFCEWPFRKELKLSIIHPETRQERLLHAKPRTEESTMKFYRRPIEVSNKAVVFNNTKVNTIDIERDGYVKQDHLLLRKARQENRNKALILRIKVTTQYMLHYKRNNDFTQVDQIEAMTAATISTKRLTQFPI
ncbi:hypothetical protein HPB48_017282 [Haemaphysalis longicornis]|uniref:RING-type domain-containing protein n=1 Tax=Haemaphysalis longicornis TaxID=44386 RepID=A0A9J6FRH8_HAELO|nr:hypothetical protein HPB48_017282 [Haemaphysalis longicornis]